MNDLEYQRQTPVYTRDLYAELERIEQRGKRKNKSRANLLARLFRNRAGTERKDRATA